MPANIKDLDKRIRSVKNTQQITKAMKMVAAAKLRRTQDRLLGSRPYSDRLAAMLKQLSATTDIDHPFLQPREVHKRLVLVVSSDKGLCGSYNAAVIRETQKYLEANRGVDTKLYIIGRKAGEYFRRREWEVVDIVDDLGGMIDVTRVYRIADQLMRSYLSEEVDQVVGSYTEFISSLSQKPKIEPLLPFAAEGGETEVTAATLDYIYEPDAKTVLQQLLPKAVRDSVFKAVAEAFTSEHAARMTSMNSATDNAGELIETLTLFRNRARQAAITQEISEIVGGANALA